MSHAGFDSTHGDDSSPPEIWASRLDAEREFWRRWFETKGLEWPQDYLARIDPEFALQEHLWPFVEGRDLATFRILDVGAGPLTTIGRTHRGTRLQIVAVDPLAPTYDELLAQFGVVPPVRTIQASGEQLTATFAPGSFDLVYAQNSLDHGYDPLAAIRQMLLMAKPGGAVVLLHGQDEAERQRYDGLHQWNFRVEDGRFILWRPGARVDVADAVRDLAAPRPFACGGWVAVAFDRR